jgi:hypothetical protein
MLIKLPNGQQYASFPEKMPNPVAVENIYGEFKKKELEQTEYFDIIEFDPFIPPRYPTFGIVSYAAEPNGPSGYQVFLDTKDPANETNYYRWTAQSVTRRETTGRCGPFCRCNCKLAKPVMYPCNILILILQMMPSSTAIQSKEDRSFSRRFLQRIIFTSK